MTKAMVRLKATGKTVPWKVIRTQGSVVPKCQVSVADLKDIYLPLHSLQTTHRRDCLATCNHLHRDYLTL